MARPRSAAHLSRAGQPGKVDPIASGARIFHNRLIFALASDL
jgi:hypothetical protein